MNEKRSTHRSGRIRGRIAVVFCLMLAAVLVPLGAFAAPRTDSDVSATYLNSATISLTSTGANRTYYQLDSADPVLGMSVTTGVYGPHVLSFWSKDTSDVVETAIKAPFFVDEDIAPTLVCDAKDSYVVTATIEITATDNFNGSGVDFVCYRVDGGAYETVLSPASAAATKLLNARLAKVQVAPTAIDPPVDPTLPPPHADKGPCASCHDLITPTPEPTSTPGPVITLSPKVTVTGLGAHTLEYWAQDMARNESEHITSEFVITGQATRASIHANHSQITRNHSVKLYGWLVPGLPVGTSVTIQMRKPGSSTWRNESTATTSLSGSWSFTRKLTARGKYYFRAVFAGSDTFAAKTSSSVRVTSK